jgi:hypothetical protein
MTENRAKGCQLSGQSSFSSEPIEPHDRRVSGPWLMILLLTVILILFLGAPAAFADQIQEGSWPNLNHLQTGQGIEVIESSLKRHAGAFVTLSDESLTLKENGSDVSIKRENVARVSTSSGPRRGEHAVIGLVVGAAIGAGIGAASGSSTGFLGKSSRGIAALVGLAIGAPSGAAVGAVLPAHTTIYRVPAAPSH